MAVPGMSSSAADAHLVGQYIDFLRDPSGFSDARHELISGAGVIPFHGRGVYGGDVNVFRGRGGFVLGAPRGSSVRYGPGAITSFGVHVRPSYGRRTGRGARRFRSMRGRRGVTGLGIGSTIRAAGERLGHLGARAARFVLPILGVAAGTALARQAVLGFASGASPSEVVAAAARGVRQNLPVDIAREAMVGSRGGAAAQIIGAAAGALTSDPRVIPDIAARVGRAFPSAAARRRALEHARSREIAAFRRRAAAQAADARAFEQGRVRRREDAIQRALDEFAERERQRNIARAV